MKKKKSFIMKNENFFWVQNLKWATAHLSRKNCMYPKVLSLFSICMYPKVLSLYETVISV